MKSANENPTHGTIDRPSFDAAMAVDAFFERLPVEHLFERVCSGPGALPFDGNRPRPGDQVRGCKLRGEVLVVAAGEFVEVVVRRDRVPRCRRLRDAETARAHIGELLPVSGGETFCENPLRPAHCGRRRDRSRGRGAEELAPVQVQLLLSNFCTRDLHRRASAKRQYPMQPTNGRTGPFVRRRPPAIRARRAWRVPTIAQVATGHGRPSSIGSSLFTSSCCCVRP